MADVRRVDVSRIPPADEICYFPDSRSLVGLQYAFIEHRFKEGTSAELWVAKHRPDGSSDLISSFKLGKGAYGLAADTQNNVVFVHVERYLDADAKGTFEVWAFQLDSQQTKLERNEKLTSDLADCVASFQDWRMGGEPPHAHPGTILWSLNSDSLLLVSSNGTLGAIQRKGTGITFLGGDLLEKAAGYPGMSPSADLSGNRKFAASAISFYEDTGLRVIIRCWDLETNRLIGELQIHGERPRQWMPMAPLLFTSNDQLAVVLPDKLVKVRISDELEITGSTPRQLEPCVRAWFIEKDRSILLQTLRSDVERKPSFEKISLESEG